MSNSLLKQLYELTEKTIININETNKVNFDRADQIITWIVGFAIGIFVFIFSSENLEDIQKITGIKLLILNLSLSIIISGLLYRIFSFLTQTLNSMIINDILSFSRGSNLNFDDILVPREILGNETTLQIAEYLEEDFDYKPPYEINEEDENLRKLLLNYYNILASNNNIEEQLLHFKIQISKYFGINHKYFEFFTIEKNIKIRGRIYIFGVITTSILSILTIGIFIIGAAKLLVKINSL